MAASGCEIPHNSLIRRRTPECGRRYPADSLKEVAMRNIWMSRLGRASTVLAIASIGITAMGLGASAEAREYGYWDRWGYHHYYSHP